MQIRIGPSPVLGCSNGWARAVWSKSIRAEWQAPTLHPVAFPRGQAWGCTAPLLRAIWASRVIASHSSRMISLNLLLWM